jgi:exopolysaccharide biosynthesis polyprenyl glycosylphosphotransferase
MSDTKYKIAYIFVDIISTKVAAALLFLFLYGDGQYSIPNFAIQLFSLDLQMLLFFGVLLMCWLGVYYIQGTYSDVWQKSRLQELAQTFRALFFGYLILLILLIAGALKTDIRDVLPVISLLFLLHFLVSYIPRLIITSIIIYRIRNGKIFFPTLLAGSNGKANGIYEELSAMPKSRGNKFIGFVSVRKEPSIAFCQKLNHLGDINQLEEIIDQYGVKEIIIATEEKEYELIGHIISVAAVKNVRLRIIPDIYDYLIGRVRLSYLHDIPLIEVNQNLMPLWQQYVKRLMDIIVSLLSLIVLFPVLLGIAFSIKLNSKGPVIYSHQRIGRFGKPFRIYKFRSMFVNAEEKGPQLATPDDPRITKLGKFLRKTRLDELPQFFNVLVGDMSLVGPRPERQFYINKIVEKASHYKKLQRIKPGITSWGQVKYGYAENVEQMIERLKYDIVYLEDMSLYTDLKILIYTMYILIKANGR